MDKPQTPENRHPILDRVPRIRLAADRHGFDCLDDTWNGHHARYRFRCREGHEFLHGLLGFSRSQQMRCPQCSQAARWAKLNDLALKASVRCLEERWLGGNKHHRFECEQGHTWARTGSHALTAVGCKACALAPMYASKRHASWLRLLEVAAARGGWFLATDYAGTNHTYPFRCAEGHEWHANGSDVLRRTWCPECARLRKVNDYRHKNGLARLHEEAIARGGRCLSGIYEGTKAHYRFRCARSHEWETTGNRFLRGGWCLTCANDKKRLTLEDAQQAAQARGGQCLSTSYIRVTEKLHWLCERGHGWHSTFASIRAGSWCPECAHMDRITNPKSKAWKRYKAAPL